MCHILEGEVLKKGFDLKKNALLPFFCIMKRKQRHENKGKLRKNEQCRDHS